jgi:ATP-dependent helicase/nuclease subunit A
LSTSARSPWNPTGEQREALAARGVSVALSSGAGCGKTSVLTNRYLAELEGPYRRPLGQVVALTFTEKAARELRERVRRACRDRLEAGDDPAYWRAVVRGLEVAPITTFHGFCGQLLRRYPIEAGVAPGFAILEESIAPSVRDEALAACLRRWLADGDEDLAALAVEYGLNAVREALSAAIDARASFDAATWAGRPPEEVVAAWADRWEREVRPAILRSVRESAAPLLRLLAANSCEHEVMNSRKAYLLEHLPALAEAADPVAALRDLRERAKVQGGGTKKHWPSESIYDAVRDGLADLRESIGAALEALDRDDVASRGAAALGLRFARLAAGAVAAFDRAKRGAGLLDFDDLLLKARDLLRDGPESARRQAADAIGILLVDEFQDTDPIQAEILELLTGEGLEQGRLFLVGDRKQSIYRFRRAQPRIFQEFRGRFPEQGRLALTENFRSVPGLIAFVNALFADLYEDEGEALRASSTAPASDVPVVEFLWADEPPADGAGKVPVEQRRRVEARWIARHLARRIGEGWPIRDPKTGAARAARAGDVVLLFRTLNDAAPYESALVAEGLDYYVQGGSAYFAQQEVLDLINLLSAVEDPLDALALAATLRGPFFGVSDDGLYWLATTASDLPRGFEGWRRIAELSTEDRRRVGRAHALLARWRAAKDRLPIADLIGLALDESGYEAALLGEFLGPRKRANVRKLVRQARRFDLHGGYTLADFVARLRADLRKPPREEQAATTDEQGDAVRLMTIHQAKGLEFPIVVVADLDRDVPIARDWVAFHPELGPLVKPPADGDAAEGSSGSGQSLGWATYRHIELREEQAEALRLFYVAATRARDALILSAGVVIDDEPKSPAMTLLHARFDRTSGACRVPLPEGWPSPQVRVVAEPPLPSGRGAGGRPRPKLLRVARTITAAPVLTEPIAPTRARRPRWLDLDPAASLPPLAARVDRLVRAILADPAALDPKKLAAIADREARAQVPASPPSVVAAARDRLAPWIAGRLARELARAPEARRAIPWAVAWPPDDPEPTVVRGQLDLAYRDARGDWCLIVVADPAAPEAAERLRLLLSARAAAAVGIGPIVRGWRVRLGPAGGLSGEESFGPDEIERAYEACLRRQASPPGPLPPPGGFAQEPPLAP